MVERLTANKMSALTGVWERATFTVPDTVPDERVRAESLKYMGRFGKALEAQGFIVREMLRPQVSVRQIPTEQGRRRYDIFAFVSRRPVVSTLDIPDKLVTGMQARGLRLK